MVGSVWLLFLKTVCEIEVDCVGRQGVVVVVVVGQTKEKKVERVCGREGRQQQQQTLVEARPRQVAVHVSQSFLESACSRGDVEEASQVFSREVSALDIRMENGLGEELDRRCRCCCCCC